jgi:predicted extracellular nuclease
MAIDPAAVTLIHTGFKAQELVSPLNGNNVTIEGIVVGDFQDGLGTHGNFKRFFFVQEEDRCLILILILRRNSCI